MKRIKNGLDSIIKALELVLVLGIILCVVLQILYRYIFDGYLIWTEETRKIPFAMDSVFGHGILLWAFGAFDSGCAYL